MSSRQLALVEHAASFLSAACDMFLLGALLIAVQSLFQATGIMPMYKWLVVVNFTGWLLAPALSNVKIPKLAEMHSRGVTSTVVGVFAMTLAARIVLPVSIEVHWIVLLSLGLGVWLRGMWVRLAPLVSDNNRLRLPAGAGLMAVCASVSPGYLGLLTPLIIFWATAIIGVSMLTYLAELRRRNRGTSPNLARFWTPLLAGVTALCVLAAILFSVLTPAFARLIYAVLGLLLWVIRAIFLSLGFAMAALLQSLISLISKRQFRREELGQLYVPDPADWLGKHETSGISQSAEKWLAGISLSVVLLIAAAVAAHVLWRGRQRRANEDPDEDRQVEASWEVLKNWANAQWADLSEALGNAGKRFALRPRPRTATEVYNAVLVLARRHGLKKPPETTAHRFQPTLTGGLPCEAGCLDEILDAFSQEYYAEHHLTAEKTQEICKTYETLAKNQSHRKEAGPQ